MAFSIKFFNETVSTEYGEHLNVNLNLGDLKESVAIPVGYWSKHDYIMQWIKALDRLLDDDDSNSVLITQMYSPQNKRHGYLIECWPLFRRANKIYIHNAYFDRDGVPDPFSIEVFYRLTDDRGSSTDMSQWEADLQEVKEFRDSLESW